jgi:hypothetical protein
LCNLPGAIFLVLGKFLRRGLTLAEYFDIDKVVLTMCRMRNDIQVGAALSGGQILTAAAEAALMCVIIIIEGNRRAP